MPKQTETTLTQEQQADRLRDEVAELRTAIAALDIQDSAPGMGLEVAPSEGSLLSQVNAEIQRIKDSESDAAAAAKKLEQRQGLESLLSQKSQALAELEAAIAREQFLGELEAERQVRAELMAEYNVLGEKLLEVGRKLLNAPTDRIRENQQHPNVINGVLLHPTVAIENDFLWIRNTPLLSGSARDLMELGNQIQTHPSSPVSGLNQNGVVEFVG